MPDCTSANIMCNRCYDIYEELAPTFRPIELKPKQGAHAAIYWNTFPDSTDLVFADTLATVVTRTFQTVYGIDTNVWKSIIKNNANGTFTLTILIDFQRLTKMDMFDTVFGQFPLAINTWHRKGIKDDKGDGMHLSLGRLMFFRDIHLARQSRTLVSEDLKS